MIKEFKFTNYFGESLSIKLIKDEKSEEIFPIPKNYTIVHDRFGICYDYDSSEINYNYFDKFVSVVNLNQRKTELNYYKNTNDEYLDFYQILSFISYCRGLEFVFNENKMIEYIQVFNYMNDENFDTIEILIAQDKCEPDYNIDKFKQFLNKIWEEN